MSPAGIVRRLDATGRIIIPKDIRRKIKIKEGMTFGILMDGNKIVIKKQNVNNSNQVNESDIPIRRINDNGSILIPNEIIRKLKLEEGMPLEFFLDGEKIVLQDYYEECEHDVSNKGITVIEVLEALEYYKHSDMPIFINRKGEPLSGCYIDDREAVMLINVFDKEILKKNKDFYNITNVSNVKELYAYLQGNCSFDMYITTNIVGEIVTGMSMQLTGLEYVWFDTKNEEELSEPPYQYSIANDEDEESV